MLTRKPAVPTGPHHRPPGVASGLIAILILLPGLAFWAAVATYQAGAKAQQATQIQNAFEAARFAVGEEEFLERKYRLEPNKEVRAEHAAAGLSMVTSLQRAVRLGSDRSFLDKLNLVLHTRYLAAVASMFEMIDAGDTRRADEIDVNEADPSFDSIETRVSVAADEGSQCAAPICSVGQYPDQGVVRDADRVRAWPLPGGIFQRRSSLLPAWCGGGDAA